MPVVIGLRPGGASGASAARRHSAGRRSPTARSMLDDRLHGRTRTRAVERAVVERRVQRDPHRREVLGGGAAAAADDASTGVDGQAHVAGHELGRARVVDLGAAELRDRRSCPSTRTRSRRRARSWRGATRGCRTRRRRSWRRSPAAGPSSAVEHLREVAGEHAHHRAPGGVERARRHVRDPDGDGGIRGGRAPPRVPTSSRSTRRRRRRRRALRSPRRTSRARRASVSSPSGSNSDPVGPTDPATTTGRSAASATSPASSAARCASSPDAGLGAVQGEAVAVAAEGVGQDDVGAGVHEPPVQVLHPVGLVDVPELGCLAGLEPHREVVGAGGAVGEQDTLGGEELGETGAHARTVPHPDRWGATFPRFRGALVSEGA